MNYPSVLIIYLFILLISSKRANAALPLMPTEFLLANWVHYINLFLITVALCGGFGLLGMSYAQRKVLKHCCKMNEKHLETLKKYAEKNNLLNCSENSNEIHCIPEQKNDQGIPEIENMPKNKIDETPKNEIEVAAKIDDQNSAKNEIEIPAESKIVLEVQ